MAVAVLGAGCFEPPAGTTCQYECGDGDACPGGLTCGAFDVCVVDPADVATCRPTLVDVVVGGGHGCALDSFGEAWCWGGNGSGELGFPSAEAAFVMPSRVLGPLEDASFAGAPTPRRWSQIAVGGAHTCGVLGDEPDQVYCWGRNTDGEVDPTRAGEPTVEVTAVLALEQRGPVLALALGSAHTCVLQQVADGAPNQVRCWGDNSSAQSALDLSPIDFGDDEPVAISSTNNHNCALLRAGWVACWGKNTFDQLGAPGPNDGPQGMGTIQTPIRVADRVQPPERPMLAGVAAAWNSSCAITTDDEAFPLLCWGANNQAQLGLPQYYDPKGTPPDPLPPPPNIEFTAEPVSAPDAPWFATIAAGGECGCGLDRAGGVWCWGDANDGCLADENETGNDGKALHVGLSAAATRLAMGGTEVSVNTGTGVGEKGTACAVIGEGSVVCWGNNLTGQADPRAATAQDRVIVPFAIPILPLP